MCDHCWYCTVPVESLWTRGYEALWHDRVYGPLVLPDDPRRYQPCYGTLSYLLTNTEVSQTSRCRISQLQTFPLLNLARILFKDFRQALYGTCCPAFSSPLRGRVWPFRCWASGQEEGLCRLANNTLILRIVYKTLLLPFSVLDFARTPALKP